MKNADGENVGLKEGAQVDVVIVATSETLLEKPE